MELNPAMPHRNRFVLRATLATIALTFGFWTGAGCASTGARRAPMLAGVLPTTQPGELRFAPIFTSNMVLQRDMPLPIFGSARPGDSVTVTLQGESRTAVADAKGKWQVRFEPLAAGGPFELSATDRENGKDKTVALTNVLAGEVWVCSGQSNMELLVRQCNNPAQEIAAAHYPRIRINSSGAAFAKASGRDWVECDAACVGNCSAVGYFFGRELHEDLDVPIGLVIRAVGGTVIKQWAPRSGEMVEGDAELRPLNEDWKRAVAMYAASKQTFSAWQATTRQAKGSTAGISPPAPLDPQRFGGMYEGQIAPLAPFAIRGVIWYQGETDARTGHEDDQRSTLPLMIRAWRKAWGEGDFPFLLVQLANDWGGSGFNKPPELPALPPDNQHWPWVREAQAAACKLLPNIGMACTIDLGGKIHYPGKQDVGRRLAHVAEAQVYHVAIVATGPSYAAMETEASAIRLRFTGIGGGLRTRDGASAQGFAIAGADRKFVWAEAKIDGDTVVVRSGRVAQPVAVRYDWLNDPHGNLYNTEGLPAAPFRTDDWPRISEAQTASGVTAPREADARR
jgi:sialate O-acetylesterase